MERRRADRAVRHPQRQREQLSVPARAGDDTAPGPHRGRHRAALRPRQPAGAGDHRSPTRHQRRIEYGRSVGVSQSDQNNFRMKRFLDIAMPLLVAMLVLGAWEWAVAHWQVPVYVLPGPSAIVRAFSDNFASLMA